jgi:hypothetical protein
LGWVALGRIRRSGGSIRGRGMALFDGLFYPVMALAAVVVVMVLG